MRAEKIVLDGIELRKMQEEGYQTQDWRVVRRFTIKMHRTTVSSLWGNMNTQNKIHNM